MGLCNCRFPQLRKGSHDPTFNIDSRFDRNCVDSRLRPAEVTGVDSRMGISASVVNTDAHNDQPRTAFRCRQVAR
jgi:hypothetical protein